MGASLRTGGVPLSRAEVERQAADDPLARGGGYVSVLAAVTSIALVAGAGWWGFRLAVRDVSGIPVVRALEGPMREAPADPGGTFAANQGLSVNRIASEGSSAPPADEVVLAPRSNDVDSDDATGLALPGAAAGTASAAPGAGQDMAVTAALSAVAPEAVQPDDAVPGVAELEGAASPSAEPAAAEPEPQRDAIADAVSAALAGTDLDAQTPDEVPAPETDVGNPQGAGSLARSPRPMPRPLPRLGGDAPASTITGVTPTSADLDVPETDGTTLASGTRLVQLGAFDTVPAARAEWTRLAGRFGDLLQGKARIVQPARSGGRDFVRLRAQGFADEPDQRRFCAALSAENASCIPVTVR